MPAGAHKVSSAVPGDHQFSTPAKPVSQSEAKGDECLINAWVKTSCERFADPRPRLTEKSGMIPGT
jgi:hypothetical protein